jgi:hypothetical protein
MPRRDDLRSGVLGRAGGAVCQPHAVQALECAIELPSIHLTAHNDQPYIPCPKDALVYARPAFLRPCAVMLTPPPTAVNWTDAQHRVIKSYRDWVRSV